jgi:hypothetical protein
MEPTARRWVEVLRDPPWDSLGDPSASELGEGVHQTKGIWMKRISE